MNIIFGTDGWRGLLDSEANSESISLVAQAFADYNLQRFSNPRIAIGFDGRRNSKEFAILFAEILSGNNMEVYLSEKIIPTPFLSLYVKQTNLNSGVMITASHNPPEYNGVKFKANYGGPFLTEETLKVEELIGKSSVKKNSEELEKINFLHAYFSQIQKLINFELIRQSKIKILIDSMGGAGSDYLEQILKLNNIQAKTIFNPPSENFYGRLPEPIEKNLKELKVELENNQYSLGVATDGDADRIGILSDDGKWISSQETILLLADYIINKKYFEGSVVKTSSVTDKLKSLFENEQRKVLDVQVGFKYITEEMVKCNIAFGCEESGGFGYGVHMPERDGILSALLIIEMLAQSGYLKLSEYVTHKRKELGLIHYSRADFQYNKPKRSEILPKIFSKPSEKIGLFKIKETKIFLSSRGIINGIKYIFEGDSRWLLLRASETEPMVRIYAEGQSDAEVSKLLSEGKKLIYES